MKNRTQICPVNEAILVYSMENPGLSFAEIADNFGVTRNKVAGALWRRGRSSVDRYEQMLREANAHSN